MKRLQRLIAIVLGAAMIAGCTSNARSVMTNNFSPIDATAQNKLLGRGINMGNMLEAPTEGEWGLMLDASYPGIVRRAGFSGIRIPIRWSAHAAQQAPYTIDPPFLTRIDQVVKNALDHGLLVIINMHHYDALTADPQGQKERFIALWQQIANHYQAYSANLLFEPLNEPNDKLNDTQWNQLLADLLPVIRARNPQRNLIVGPAQWNAVNQLDTLKLPEADRHLIVTFHYYNPFQFTHQGAEWVDNSAGWLGTTWQANTIERYNVTGDLDLAEAWAKRNNRPLFMGEFGAYSKGNMASRTRWTAFVAREAEKRGISWAYWEFGAGFGAYDPAANAWRTPLLEALLPAKSS